MDPGRALAEWAYDKSLDGVVSVAKSVLCGASPLKLSDIPGEFPRLPHTTPVLPRCLHVLLGSGRCGLALTQLHSRPYSAPLPGWLDGSASGSMMSLRTLGQLATVGCSRCSSGSCLPSLLLLCCCCCAGRMGYKLGDLISALSVCLFLPTYCCPPCRATPTSASSLPGAWPAPLPPTRRPPATCSASSRLWAATESAEEEEGVQGWG